MPRIQDFGNVASSVLKKVNALEITSLFVVYTLFMEAECFSVLTASVYCRTGTLCMAVGTVGCCPDPSPSPPCSCETLKSAAKSADASGHS